MLCSQHLRGVRHLLTRPLSIRRRQWHPVVDVPNFGKGFCQLCFVTPRASLMSSTRDVRWLCEVHREAKEISSVNIDRCIRWRDVEEALSRSNDSPQARSLMNGQRNLNTSLPTTAHSIKRSCEMCSPKTTRRGTRLPTRNHC